MSFQRAFSWPALAAALTLSLAPVLASEAQAWDRTKTVTNGEKSRTVNRSGSCADGTCSGTTTRTGPNGNSGTVNRSTSRGDDGVSTSTSRTGPRGNTATRNSTRSCDGQGNCSSSTTVTR